MNMRPEEVDLRLVGGVQVVLHLAEEIRLPLRWVGVRDLERLRRLRGRHLHQLGSGIRGDVVHVLLQLRRHHRRHPFPHH